MRRHLGVASLRFISLDGLYRAVGESQGRDPNAPQYCDACFSGEYPVRPTDMLKRGFEMQEGRRVECRRHEPAPGSGAEDRRRRP